MNDGELFDLGILAKAVRYQGLVADLLGPVLGGDVLEVGAGTGNLSVELCRRAESLTVVEPNPVLAERLRSRIGDSAVVVEAPIESVEPVPRFDGVVSANVLEHVEDDAAVVRRIFDILRPGGRIGLFLPAHPALFGSLDARYEHLRRYRRADVERLLVGAGFVPEVVNYVNPVGALGWFVATRILRVRSISAVSVSVSERVAVPVARWLARYRLPLGQSVLAIGRKDVR